MKQALLEAGQFKLGEWRSDVFSFQKYGWVQSINAPIFKADTTDIETGDFEYLEYILGVIPSTTLPSVINLQNLLAITWQS